MKTRTFYNYDWGGVDEDEALPSDLPAENDDKHSGQEQEAVEFTTEMQRLDADELQVMLQRHKHWAESGNTDLKDPNRADFSGIDLHGTNLSGIDLRKAKLVKARLFKVNFNEANLRWADLLGSDMRGTDLRGADLRMANLRMANLQWAWLRWSDLRGADFRGADLRGADLRGVKHLKFANLTDAIVNADTKFPEGFNVPKGVVFVSGSKLSKGGSEFMQPPTADPEAAEPGAASAEGRNGQASAQLFDKVCQTLGLDGAKLDASATMLINKIVCNMKE